MLLDKNIKLKMFYRLKLFTRREYGIALELNDSVIIHFSPYIIIQWRAAPLKHVLHTIVKLLKPDEVVTNHMK